MLDKKPFISNFFNKRDAFPFCMPHLLNNMPSKMFYTTISAEFLQICRATFKYSNFLLSCEKHIFRMIKQLLLLLSYFFTVYLLVDLEH